MLNLKKGLAVVLAAATALTFAPVANLGQAVSVEAAANIASQKDITLIKDDTLSFDLKKFDDVVDNDSIIVKSSDKDVVTVKLTDGEESEKVTKKNSELGTAATVTLTAKKAGTATITVVDETKNGDVTKNSFKVAVNDTIQMITVDPTEIKAEQLGSKATDISDGNGNSKTITVTLKNQSNDRNKVSFVKAVSNNTNVVSLDTTDAKAFSDSKTATFTATYKGVGTTTIDVQGYVADKDDSTKAGKAVSGVRAKISVTITDKTDSLTVTYGGRSYKLTAAPKSTGVTSSAEALTGDTLYLNTTTNKTAKIDAVDALGRQIIYSSDNAGLFAVDNNGNVAIADDFAQKNLAYSTGRTYNIEVTVPVKNPTKKDDDTNNTDGYDNMTIRIPVAFTDRAATTLKVTDTSNGKVIGEASGNNTANTTVDGNSLVVKEEDLPVIVLSTKDKKTATLKIESSAGAGYVSGAVYQFASDATEADKKYVVQDGTAKVVADSDFVSYKDGVLTAKKDSGDDYAYVNISSRASTSTYGEPSLWFKVQVTDQYAANQIVATPSTINLSKSNTSATIKATAPYGTDFKFQTVSGSGKTDVVTNADISVDSVFGVVKYTGSNTGTAYIMITGAATVGAIEPQAAWVAVNYSSTKAANGLSVVTNPATVNVNGTVSLGASTTSTGSAISYKSANENVATVDANGVVTGKEEGVTFITVTASETTDAAEGSIVVPVTVKAENINVKPAKVTGVKVTNLKGGKVKVTWTKSTNPNVKYYVKKTVGKKSAGKSVGSNKTTLTVKKGATVKVKVKAYVYDGENKLVGAYSATVSRKTDKK